MTVFCTENFAEIVIKYTWTWNFAPMMSVMLRGSRVRGGKTWIGIGVELQKKTIGLENVCLIDNEKYVFVDIAFYWNWHLKNNEKNYFINPSKTNLIRFSP